jgi:hypothetical protein
MALEYYDLFLFALLFYLSFALQHVYFFECAINLLMTIFVMHNFAAFSKSVSTKEYPIHLYIVFFLIFWTNIRLFYWFLFPCHQFSGAECTFPCVHSSIGKITVGHSNVHRLTWCWNQKYRLSFLHWKGTTEVPFFSVRFGWKNQHLKGKLLADTRFGSFDSPTTSELLSSLATVPWCGG